MRDRVLDLLFHLAEYWVEFLIGLVLVFGVAFMILAVSEEAKERDRFFDECTQDHRVYECEVLWGQAHPAPERAIVQQLPRRSP